MKSTILSLIVGFIIFTASVVSALDFSTKNDKSQEVLHLAGKFCNDEIALRACYAKFESCTTACKAKGEPLNGSCVDMCRNEMENCRQRC